MKSLTFIPNRVFIIALAAGLAAGLLSACQTNPDTATTAAATTTTAPNASPGARSDSRASGPTAPERIAENVEQLYVVGPDAARRMGFQIDWQNPAAGRNVRQVVVADDSVFTLDERNLLSRFKRETGDRLWTTPASDPVDNIIGITYRSELERIYLTSGGAIYVLDSQNGSLVDKQNLAKIANTPPVAHGNFFIYGSRGGQLIWHGYRVGAEWRGYQVAPSIDIKPVLNDSVIVAAGNNGTLIALDANQARSFWQRSLLDKIVAQPAVAHGAVFVTSLDQHVRAYDLGNGRNLWRYLTESPLTESPTVIDQSVYVQIPTEGLVCFDALPPDSPGGVVRWSSQDVQGNIIAGRNDRLLAWHSASKTMKVVGKRRGYVIDTLKLDKVHQLNCIDTAANELYLVSRDGRLLRLVRR